ncbi:hypothetical protein [Clostridium manihotivorum]|uniref:Uncharacterized protein n=1 Tax=Clostridium manihotivorum TaxID=2320868 RepID=A0A410DV97_9CLOT|nr:hypothetical protein [Clostridium manihotivorum]QAA32985.1 hypothetical protein C1I91_15805 [Clostridium manihotivorum]
MKEKIGALVRSEKLRGVSKKVFNKKTITGAIIIIVLVIALRVAFSLAFEVEGTVTKVDGSKVTVANFIATKTVDIGNFQTSLSNIQVGDRIEIQKNLSGDIISVRDRNNGNFKGNRDRLERNGNNNFKNNEQHNSKR